MGQKIYIFGAHSRAQTLAVYLQYLYPDIVIEAYLYNNEEPNPSEIFGVPVWYLDMEVSEHLHKEYSVLVGTRGIYHPQIIEYLQKLGFCNIYPVTVELDLKLRNAYLEKYFVSAKRAFIKIEQLSVKGEQIIQQPSIATVYVVKSVFDKPLQQNYLLAPYEREIQVGAALTKERLSENILTDNMEGHISDRNKQFCELTALYWIWKHATEDIVGLVHYRRHFLLPDDWIARMDAHNIDVILPVPLYVTPNLEQNFKKRHLAAEWDYMMKCLKESDENTYQEATNFFQGNLYSPCNMLIIRNHVLDELCSWLFPILFRVAEHGGQKEDAYQNRYPGFLSERLLTFFMEKHREKYNIVYADKNFLP